MKPTETSFTADEICRIIKTIGESGVSYVKYGKLEIQGPGKAIPEKEEVLTWVSATEPEVELPTKDTPPQGLSSKKEEIEEHLDDLLLDDPKAYEDAVMRGELDATTD